MKKAVMFFAEGFEEVEALTTVDLLIRAGVDVQLVSIADSEIVKGSHGIGVQMNAKMGDVSVKDMDAALLPGGIPGTPNLKASEFVGTFIKDMYAAGKIVAAICAAPTVFGYLGIVKDKKVTSYPGTGDDIQCAEYLTDKVVIDGNVITSRGVGTAIDFALAIIGQLVSSDVAAKIKSDIVY
ncbi:DJ-1 family glyoxalase III [Eubacterium xylanophilum]|uniref:DJ-1 family glyoxalase III n=1 Tax=Eubacterium xylanophilum TaxID=39497 RepID=UPI00047B4D13|nr:DJ-1 family glyoxalase III [Eubacterium xylanophilum]